MGKPKEKETNSMVNMQKAAVIGCGFVGSASAFALARSGIFSELVLLDVNQAKAEGEAMDISHGVPFTRPMRITAGDYPDLKDCALIVITAGANQKPGETRLDLVKKNTAIMKSIIDPLIKVNREAILLIVSNPVDILTWAAQKLSGLPNWQVMGSGTVLDTARLKYLLGTHLKVDPRSVHAFIIGEHGDSELAVWSGANVSGVDLDHFCALCGEQCHGEVMRRIYQDVRDSAYEIIERKGATYYGIAAAVTRIAQCIVRDEHSVMPVSTNLHGLYGVPDLCMSVPAIVGRGGVEQVLEIEMNDEERERFQASAVTLREVADSLGL